MFLHFILLMNFCDRSKSSKFKTFLSEEKNSPTLVYIQGLRMNFAAKKRKNIGILAQIQSEQ